MTKLLPGLLLLAAGACTQQAPTALSDLQTSYGDATLEIASFSQISVELKVSGVGCPRLSDDVVATFDGIPMLVARGGESDAFDGCYPIGFSISKMPLATAQLYERTAARSDLVIEDASSSWTVASTRMFSNTFVIDEANSQVVWEDVSTISTAQLTPHVDSTIEGNAINYPKGTIITSVAAYAHPTPSVCNGPASCLVDLNGARTFSGTNPQL